MRYDKQLIDYNFLYYGYTLSSLWGLREELVNFKNELEKIKDGFVKNLEINNENLNKLDQLLTQLAFVRENLVIIEDVMIYKEGDIFEYVGVDFFIDTDVEFVCLN